MSESAREATRRKVKLTKQTRAFLLLLLGVYLFSDVVSSAHPQTDDQIVDLNLMLLSKFDEWVAYLTRRLSLNGTTSDPFDFSRASIGHNTTDTISFPSFLLALTHMYEGTKNEYYLRTIQAFVDGAIQNEINYVNVTGIGQVFFPIAYYFEGSDRDTGTIYPGIFGYIATRLFLWTGLPEYKAIADRIASESLDKLAVVKNSSDIAWSWAYYQHRDETNARMGVNRQAFLGWFYSLYGREINSTFTPLVAKVFNWIWRARLSDNYLAYSIGGTTKNPPYTAFAVWAALNAYLIDSLSFPSSLKEEIDRTMTALDRDYNARYSYLSLYFLTSALLVASKTDYFASSLTLPRVKSLLYIALRSMHFTSRGFIVGLDHLSFGFRWHQLVISGLFTSFPLDEYTLDMNQFNPVTTLNYDLGKHRFNGWTGGIFATSFKDGRDHYGSSIVHANYRTFLCGPADYQPPPSSVTITNNTYYVRAESTYLSYTADYYLYPSGVYVCDVTGTTTSTILLDNLKEWTIRVANGTERQIASLTNGSVYDFTTEFLIYLNKTNPIDRRSFYVKSPTSLWKYTLASSRPRLSFSQNHTDYRLIYSEIEAFGHLIPNANVMFNVLKFLADAHDVAQPVDFETSFGAYHNKVSELEPEAPWIPVYNEARSTPMKLIGHNFPENVSIVSWNYSENKRTLSFVVDAPSGTISKTKIYVGDKNEPTSVSGTELWGYDHETKTVTIDILHTGSAQITMFWAETTPPTTIASLSGRKGDNDWFTSYVVATLSATDDISGVNRTEYSFDNETWTTYQMPITIDYEGYTTLYYKSIDNDGNHEVAKGETIRIDITHPLGSILINDDAATSSSSSVMLTLTTDDFHSGVSQMRLSNDKTTWTPWYTFSMSKNWTMTTEDGLKTVYVEFMDNAGWVSQPYQDSILLDRTQPMANAGTDQIVTEDIQVALDGSASQDENGIASYTWTFTDLEAKTLTGPSPTYTFNTPGIYKIALNVTDDAGNWATDIITIQVLNDNDGDRIPDTTDTDDDNDGMPDDWEVDNGLDPFDEADASLDPDDDGLTNLNEFQEGSNPNTSNTEAPPLWIIGAITLVLAGVAAALTFTLRKRRQNVGII